MEQIDRVLQQRRRDWLLGCAASCAVATVVPAWAQKPEPITIKWGGTPSIELETPLYVAMSQGYLAEEGVKLDNLMMGPGARVREALASGELELADLGTGTYVVGRAKRLPQKIVFEYYSKDIFSLFVAAKHQGKVNSVADLKGKVIAVSSMGAASHMAGLSFVRKAGMKDTDVSFIALGSGDPAVAITQFERAAFDAAVIWEPTSTFVGDRKIAYPIIDVRKDADHEKWIGKNASSMVLVASEDMIQKRPEVIQRVVRALKKALAFIHAKSAQEVAAASASGFKMDAAVLTRILEPIKGNFSRDGRISRSGIAVQVDLAVGGGAVTQKLTYEDMVDPRFAGSAN